MPVRKDVIIIGAPRSGTNMLRDVLTSQPGFATWPCDEINLLWKHHHRQTPHDELAPAQATPRARDYMRTQFGRIAKRYEAHTVVEKTCATSLRGAFTAELFPEAKYLFIHRDGLDAAASTILRWDAPFDLRYVARKMRFAPPGDLPFYARQFASKRLASRRARQSGVMTEHRPVESWWGPKPHDFRALQAQHPLDELAVIQWQRCIDSTLDQICTLPSDQVHKIVYEDFVTNPSEELRRIFDFLGNSLNEKLAGLESVTSSNVGKGRSSFADEDAARLTALAARTLGRLGYV